MKAHAGQAPRRSRDLGNPRTCSGDRIIVIMARTDLYLKLELEHDEDEKPQRLADDVCRRLLRIYGVRSAEVSNMISRPEVE